MCKFQEITPENWQGNVFEKIGKQWMLITAGNADGCNTMTASWGGMGILWNKAVSFIFVRHSRHTLGFVENEDYYSLCFFPEEYRPALNLCGTVSGRDTDKIAKAGLTPVFDEAAPYFAEASAVVICKKMYADEIEGSCFLDPGIAKFYADQDYHRMFIGGITKVLVKE